MRSHATHCARLFRRCRVNHPLRGADGNSGEPQSVSVAKKPTPQLLAPSQPQPDEAVAAAVPPAPSPPPQAMPAVAPPTEVKSETYATMRPPVPMTPIEASTPEPQAAFSSADRLIDWITNYRKHPNASRVPAAVHAMLDFGLFGDEDKEWFCIGFIAGVLGTNPKDGPSLIPRMFPLPDKEQAVIIRAIAYSGRPDWRDLLEKNLARMPLRRPLIDDFLQASGQR